MAKIVLGMGTSHTPMLLAADETLPRFRETDMKIKHRDKDGNPASYDDLLLKADPRLSSMVGPNQLVERQNTARAAMKHLRQALSAASLDALIISVTIRTRAIWKTAGPPLRSTTAIPSATTTSSTDLFALPGLVHREPRGVLRRGCAADYPVHSSLALHLIESLMDVGFDLASSKRLREGEGEGHAVAYVHRHVMDSERPVPVVPISRNTDSSADAAAAATLLRTGRAIGKGGRAVSWVTPGSRARVVGPATPGLRGLRSRDPAGVA